MGEQTPVLWVTYINYPLQEYRCLRKEPESNITPSARFWHCDLSDVKGVMQVRVDGAYGFPAPRKGSA